MSFLGADPFFPERPKEAKGEEKPFTWNVSNVIDFNLNLQLSDRMNKMIEEIRREKMELHQWRSVAVSLSRPGTDVSTPRKFSATQVDVLLALHDQVGELKRKVAELEKQNAALVRQALK